MNRNSIIILVVVLIVLATVFIFHDPIAEFMVKTTQVIAGLSSSDKTDQAPKLSADAREAQREAVDPAPAKNNAEEATQSDDAVTESETTPVKLLVECVMDEMHVKRTFVDEQVVAKSHAGEQDVDLQRVENQVVTNSRVVNQKADAQKVTEQVVAKSHVETQTVTAQTVEAQKVVTTAQVTETAAEAPKAAATTVAMSGQPATVPAAPAVPTTTEPVLVAAARPPAHGVIEWVTDKVRLSKADGRRLVIQGDSGFNRLWLYAKPGYDTYLVPIDGEHEGNNLVFKIPADLPKWATYGNFQNTSTGTWSFISENVPEKSRLPVGVGTERFFFDGKDEGCAYHFPW